jgi:hypothetical protein
MVVVVSDPNGFGGAGGDRLAARTTACAGTDRNHLASVQIRSIDDELLECQSCQRLYRVEGEPDGTSRLVPL